MIREDKMKKLARIIEALAINAAFMCFGYLMLKLFCAISSSECIYILQI